MTAQHSTRREDAQLHWIRRLREDRAAHRDRRAVRGALPLAERHELARVQEADAESELRETEEPIARLDAEVERLEHEVEHLDAELLMPPEPVLADDEEREEDDAEASYRPSRLNMALLVGLGTALDAGTTVPLTQGLAIGLPFLPEGANRALPLVMGTAMAAAVPLLGHLLGRLGYRAPGEREEPVWMRTMPLWLIPTLALLAIARAYQLGSGPYGGIGDALVGLVVGLLMIIVAGAAVRHGLRVAEGKGRDARREVRRRQREPKPTAADQALERRKGTLAARRSDRAALTRRADWCRSRRQRVRAERVQAETQLRGIEWVSKLRDGHRPNVGDLVGGWGPKVDGDRPPNAEPVKGDETEGSR